MSLKNKLAVVVETSIRLSHLFHPDSTSQKQLQTLSEAQIRGTLPNITMPAPQDSTASTGKVDQKPTEAPKEAQKPMAALEEDDEFEDFPVEGT